MNYRHSYHAGGIADCVKHTILALAFERLFLKSAPLFYLDTHAGSGLYDLESEFAGKSGEAEIGVRLLQKNFTESFPTTPLKEVLSRVQHRHGDSFYPGSPLIAAELLRAQDRLALCELHPDDYAALRRLMRNDPRVGVHHRDGYEALAALIPPPERRGIVLIDPPFEIPDEFSKLGNALEAAYAKWPSGVYLAWYPIKNRTSIAETRYQLKAGKIQSYLDIEFLIDGTIRPDRLNGSGMFIINPPYQFDDRLERELSELALRLALPNAIITVTRQAV